MQIDLDTQTISSFTDLASLDLNDLRRAVRRTGYFKGNSVATNYLSKIDCIKVIEPYVLNNFDAAEHAANCLINGEKVEEIPATPPQPTPQPTPQNSADNALTIAIANALQATGFSAPKAEIDESKVIELIKQHATPAIKQIEVKQISGDFKNVGLQHKFFPQLLQLATARLNVWLYGPAGTGKTSAAKAVADALELPFGFVAFSRQSSKGDLFGIRDARGEYHESQFVRVYRDGGVILLDEIDCANDNVLKSLNAALDNGFAVTPDGVIEKHADCIVIAGANTVGNGADAEYSAAQQIDASTLDRFFFLHWPVDEAFEAALIGAAKADESADTLRGSDVPTKEQWLHVVRSARRNGSANRVWISSRAVRDGAKLIGAGVCLKDLCTGLIWRGHAKDVQGLLYTIGNARA